MTIDDLAVAAEQEFKAIRKEMATKEELNSKTQEILRAIEAIDIHLSAYASRANDDIASLQASVDGLDNRVRFLEKSK